MNKLLKAISLGITLSTFISCGSSETEDSDFVNQSRVYQGLSVDYDDEAKKLSWNAKFTFSGATGTTLELVDSSKVYVNDQRLQKTTSKLDGTFYRLSKQSKGGDSSHQFTYIDNEGTTYRNSIAMNSIDYPANLPASFSKKNDLSVKWIGHPLEDETVVLELRNTDEDKLVRVFQANNLATKIIVRTADLKELPAGNIEMKLIRNSWRNDLTESGAVGRYISATYTSKKRILKLED